MGGISLRKSMRILSVALLMTFVLALSGLAADVETAPFVWTTEGVATSAHPLAAEAGAEILAKGGNAVDAAVAVAYALAVVEPQASNLGGEGFLVISLVDGTEVAIDYRSRAPLHVNVHTPGEIGSHPHGPYTTVVPGMVKGTEKALLQYGTMSFAEVLEPAIRLAEEGIVVDEFFAQAIANAYESIFQYEATADIWLDFGLVPEPGTVLTNPDLAHTMRLLSEHGSDVFYNGEIAEAIEEATDGWVDRASLAAYEAYERDVVRGTYRGYDVVGAPPIVAGVRVIEALNILENFDLTAHDSIYTPEVTHLIAEALKVSQADYDTYVWDPNFYRVPVEGLISKQFAAERAALIDVNRAQRHSAGDPYAFNPETELFVDERSNESPSTTHISVVDKEGNAVALTQTISSFWGSRITVPGYGFLMSNHFSQFPVFNPNDPFRPDYAAPLKSTRTTLTPTILKKDGKVRLVIGSPGSWRIPQSTVHTLVGIVDFNMGLVDAMSAPKLDAFGYDLTLEGGYSEETIAALEALGHNVDVRGELDLYFGGLNVIMVEEDGTMLGVGAVRREGGASAPVAVPSPAAF